VPLLLLLLLPPPPPPPLLLIVVQAVYQGWELMNVFHLKHAPAPLHVDTSRDLLLHATPPEYHTLNVSGDGAACSFVIFWPNNAHQPGVAPKQEEEQEQQQQQQQQQGSAGPSHRVLKVVIKFRLSGSSSSSEPKADRGHSLRAIAPGTASSASCMGMASPYEQPHEDTHGSLRSENVLHRNVGCPGMCL
jgi:hypothetical protein